VRLLLLPAAAPPRSRPLGALAFARGLRMVRWAL
jgi:hypothetical protein